MKRISRLASFLWHLPQVLLGNLTLPVPTVVLGPGKATGETLKVVYEQETVFRLNFTSDQTDQVSLAIDCKAIRGNYDFPTTQIHACLSAVPWEGGGIAQIVIHILELSTGQSSETVDLDAGDSLVHRFVGYNHNYLISEVRSWFKRSGNLGWLTVSCGRHFALIKVFDCQLSHQSVQGGAPIVLSLLGSISFEENGTTGQDKSQVPATEG